MSEHHVATAATTAAPSAVAVSAAAAASATSGEHRPPSGIQASGSINALNAASSGDAWPKGKASYLMDKQLGTGATSKVYRAFCPAKNNAEIAVKVVNLDSSSVSMDELHRETQGMKKLRHENIVAYYGSFIEDQFLFILMDLCERSLLDMINHTKAARDIAHGVFDESTIATIMREVLKGLHYIHENGLVHRDIKCGNILLKRDGSVQIADFGVTAFINTNPLTGLSVNPVSRHTFVGTPCWMAPEVMEQRQYGYTQKADIWSVGITALELVTGSAPYAKFTPLKVIILTLNNDPPSLATVEEKPGQYSAYGQKFRKFVSACLVRNDAERPGAKQLIQHPFIKAKAKEKEYIVRALLSGDIPQPSQSRAAKRRSVDGQGPPGTAAAFDSASAGACYDFESTDDEDAGGSGGCGDTGREDDDWQFPEGPDTAGGSATLTGASASAASALLTEVTSAAAAAMGATAAASSADSNADNPDSRLPWYQAALASRPGCQGVSVKFRLRKRKDDAGGFGTPVLPSPTAPLDSTSSDETVTLVGTSSVSDLGSLGIGCGSGGLAELQDITFDFAVGKDKANGITLELVESGLVSMHDMVVISRALQTLVDAPWAKERMFPLNSPLPPGVFADQNEFVGYAGLSVVSSTAVFGDQREEPISIEEDA